MTCQYYICHVTSLKMVVMTHHNITHSIVRQILSRNDSMQVYMCICMSGSTPVTCTLQTGKYLTCVYSHT